MNKDLLTIQEAAKLLGVSTKTLRRWDKAGTLIPTRTQGNQRRYTKEQIITFKNRKSLPFAYPSALSLEYPTVGYSGDQASSETPESPSFKATSVKSEVKFAVPSIFKVSAFVFVLSLLVGLLTFSFSGNIGKKGLLLGIREYFFCASIRKAGPPDFACERTRWRAGPRRINYRQYSSF